MYALLPLLFFLAQPFWEAKPPEQWTAREIEAIRTNSPWAQSAGDSPAVTVFLATALPMEHAESELRLRSKSPRPLLELDPDYLDYLREHSDREFVLGVVYPSLAGLGKRDESGRMEAETVMVIGKRKYKIIGHFPPTPSDPVLRLIFPREVKSTDKTVLFRLYLPGLNFPEREAEFRVKDLTYQGKLAM
jgi:hypothetical protein